MMVEVVVSVAIVTMVTVATKMTVVPKELSRVGGYGGDRNHGCGNDDDNNGTSNVEGLGVSCSNTRGDGGNRWWWRGCETEVKKTSKGKISKSNYHEKNLICMRQGNLMPTII